MPTRAGGSRAKAGQQRQRGSQHQCRGEDRCLFSLQARKAYLPCSLSPVSALPQPARQTRSHCRVPSSLQPIFGGGGALKDRLYSEDEVAAALQSYIDANNELQVRTPATVASTVHELIQQHVVLLSSTHSCRMQSKTLLLCHGPCGAAALMLIARNWTAGPR